jgi:hypothetical protein
VYELATCTASILRGTATDAYGDTVDAATVVASGIVASIRETSRVVSDPATQQPRIVRSADGAMPAGTDVRDSDQVRDDTNGVTYIVQAVTQNREPGFTPDLQLQLKRITT